MSKKTDDQMVEQCMTTVLSDGCGLRHRCRSLFERVNRFQGLELSAPHSQPKKQKERPDSKELPR